MDDPGDLEDSGDSADETTGPGGEQTGDPDAAPEPGSGGDGDGAGTGGPVPVCPESAPCRAAVPDGWQGPVALIETSADEPPMDCAGAYPSPLPLELGLDFVDGGDATCTCQCDAVDAACELEGNLSYWDTGVTGLGCNIDPALGSFTLQGGVTWSLPAPSWVPDHSAAWQLNWSQQTLVGACEPSQQTEIPAAGFATRLTACSLDQPAATCNGDGICAPYPSAPFEGRTCIWRLGDEACPSSDYPQRRVVHSDIADDRGCPACSCSEVAGSCGEPHFTPGYYDSILGVHTWDDETIPNDGTCNGHGLPSGTVHNAISAVPGVPIDPACAPAPDTEVPYGTAMPVDPVTFCCAD